MNMKESYVTRRKLKHILSWFKNKDDFISIEIIIDTSIDYKWERTYVGKLSEFVIDPQGCYGDISEYRIKFKMNKVSMEEDGSRQDVDENTLFEETLPCDATITRCIDGGFLMSWSNGGPPCNMRISFVRRVTIASLWKSLIKII